MYTIRTRPHTYFTGTKADGIQCLLGLLSHTIAVLTFDNKGFFIEAREFAIHTDPGKGLEATIERRIDELFRLLDIRKGPIHVTPFLIESWKIGLKQFPLDLEDFLNHPDDYPEEDAPIFRKDIEEWTRAGNCVLFWGNDYLLGRDGRTL